MISPKLAFSSNEHGISLNSFYDRAGEYEPTVLVIKNTKQEVFGAFCSTSWRLRNCTSDTGIRQTYFGTGETFLFSLCKEVPKKWPWVGIHQTKEDSVPEMFMSGDNTMFTVGGGDGT